MEKFYPYKVWGVTVVVPPVLWAPYSMFFESKDGTLVFLYSVIGGSVLSLPAFALFWIAYTKLAKLDISTFQYKLLLTIVGVTGTVLTFYILSLKIFFKVGLTQFIWIGSYVILLAVSTTLFKLNE